MKLGTDYYVPKISDIRERVGKPGAYSYVPMESFRASQFCTMLRRQCHESYKKYEQALSWGIAPEQARVFLHVNHYSAFYATCNARSLMNFVVLRNDEQAQQEIRVYAEILENLLRECMPVTYQKFVANGRIAP
jgi:thymidylate synthase (FAD)